VINDTRRAAVVAVHVLVIALTLVCVVASALAHIHTVFAAVLLAPGNDVYEPVSDQKVSMVAVGYGVHPLLEELSPDRLGI
jgi:hypothetical protein